VLSVSDRWLYFTKPIIRRTEMKKRKMIYAVIIVMMCMGITGFVLCGARAETEQQKQQRGQIRENLQKQLDEMGMKVLTGSVWQKSTQGEKLSFVWGFCHAVAIEHALMQQIPALKAENFSAKVVEGMIGVKMDDVVRTVDEYYVANPSKLEMPVVRVIWDTLIKPKLKAGIAGRPLQ
jgi:hypothetical protein